MVVGGILEGHFPLRQVGGLPVITSPAEIDIANAGELRAALLAAAKRGDASVVVDMSGTAFCDSNKAECTGAGA
jgi:anti-anti-sigma regulatory factor